MNALSRGLRLLLRDPRAFRQKLSRRLRGRYAVALRPDFRSRLGLTVPEWLAYHHREIIKLKKVSWMGIPTLKCVLDSWIYQEIIYETRPDVIVEIGSWAGGSTLYLAHLLDILGRGFVISVDVDRSVYRAKHARITEITGDCGAPEVVAAVARLCEGGSALVIHDGPHDRARVLRDLHAYSAFVGVGSYLIVEDGVRDVFVPGRGIGKAEAGPLGACEEFVRQRKDFVVDRDRERYLITYNPKGYLKRIAFLGEGGPPPRVAGQAAPIVAPIHATGEPAADSNCTALILVAFGDLPS